ncbi:MAG TPA: type II toxin-antitoxin system HicA family toxin [Rhodocyclaceae bacterium]|nr:type II toxin-antitoxin system HicA family toxin [Rhodocyclaceae bacterium]
MVRRPSDVERALERKGFHRKEGDHHYFSYYTKAGKKTRVFTKTSHGVKELDDTLLGMMSRQCKLTRQDFDRLIDCPLDRDAYERKLIESGVVEAPVA